VDGTAAVDGGVALAAGRRRMAAWLRRRLPRLGLPRRLTPADAVAAALSG